MSKINLKNLIEKLNNTSKKAMELAAGPLPVTY